MRFNSIFPASLIAGLAIQSVTSQGAPPWVSLRVTTILSNPAPQPNLPSLSQALQAAAGASLNISNVQGDILIGMKKKVELFFFFHINDGTAFKKGLKTLVPQITTTTQLLQVSTQPITAVNIAFSSTGLAALGTNDTLGDPIYTQGQFLDAANLGDPGTTNWVSAFKGNSIHGLILLASDTSLAITTELQSIQALFGSSMTQLYSLQGNVRPGNEEGHEHFGFMDGISQPAITGFTANPTPGQIVIEPGHILVGESGDPANSSRPAWALDGSFLAFRQLKQLVPEFNKFLTDNPIIEPGLTLQQGSDLLGARMVGRWKSGAPVDLAPLFDDPVLAADPQRNNNFNFSHPPELPTNQTRCPFSAHIRKTAPRADLNNEVNHHIIRAGLPYGPEVTPLEAQKNTTTIERGLAFVAYQSDLGFGFHFLQNAWANNVNFVHPNTGFDPIIGANKGQPRFVSGLDPTNPSKNITLVTDFVVSRGGEYFFSPSISAISTVLST